MKLADAKPGDILQDRDGAVWLKGEHRARCIYEPMNPADTGDNASPPAESIRNPAQVEMYGPFVRLVPEEAAEW